MRRAFTLVELLIVIAVILILLALIIPLAATMQRHGYATSCANNLHQVGAGALLYINENHGNVPVHQHDIMPVHWTASLAQYLDTSWAWNQPTMNLKAKLYQCPALGADDLTALPSDVATTGYYVNYAMHEASSSPTPGYGGSYTYNHGVAYNYYILNIQRVSDQSSFVLFMDTDNSAWYYDVQSTWLTDGPSGGPMVAFRHDLATNVEYLDGHVGRLEKDTFTTAFTNTYSLVAKY